MKIWRADGTILYSDETRLIGARYPLGEEEHDVLRRGGTRAEVSDLDKPENRFETGSGGLVEVYTRIVSPEDEPMLFEVYYSADDLATTLTGGLTVQELPDEIRTVIGHAMQPTDFVLPPLPNQLFTRDTSAWLFGGVSINP